MSLTPSTTRDRQARRVAWSSFLGSTIEFYDFLLYGAAAALVFDKLFFSDLSPAMGTVASFATLATGYVTRPLGGIVFGHFGDRVGRKSVLVLTMTLMGVASFVIGLLPTYDQIGLWAPALLVLARLLQGLAVGGEWGGATLMSFEHSRPERRGLAASFAGMGGPTGAVLATGVFTAFSTLPDDQFLTWGWRVPFLLSVVLLACGLFVRLKVTESPLFTEAQNEAAASADRTEIPLFTILRRYPKQVALSCVGGWGAMVWQSLPATFMITYAIQLGHDRTTVLLAQVISSILQIGMVGAYAALSDRLGRRPVMIGGALALAVASYPVLWLLGGGTAQLYLAFLLINSLLQPAMYGPLAAFISEMFGTSSRYTGASLGYQLSATLGAGFTPLIASSLLAAAGGGQQIGLVALFAAAACLLSVAAVTLSKESRYTLPDPSEQSPLMPSLKTR
ncbi:MFS transporter [Streptomyces adelaidensis]|uniref:MFS transporter n=1 Tax=Streptomyces adelaidensis TaxID=2796465 RepID=UPI0019032073|nr:MFS transporter [Streptomyces adelaidensis]